MGHGDRWAALDRDEARIFEHYIRTATERGRPVGDVPPNAAAVPGTKLALAWEPGPFGVMAYLMSHPEKTNVQFESALPYSLVTVRADIEISAIHRHDDSAMEGHIEGYLGADGDLPITFYDLHFFANAPLYEVGQVRSFEIGAMAFQVGRAPRQDVEITDPELIRSMREATGSAATDSSPITISSEGAAIMLPIGQGWEEYEYRVQGAVQSVSETVGQGQRFTVMTARVLRDDVEGAFLDLPILTTSHVWATERVGVGDDLAAAIWVHGRLEQS